MVMPLKILKNACDWLSMRDRALDKARFLLSQRHSWQVGGVWLREYQTDHKEKMLKGLRRNTLAQAWEEENIYSPKARSRNGKLTHNNQFIFRLAHFVFRHGGQLAQPMPAFNAFQQVVIVSGRKDQIAGRLVNC